MGLFQLSNKEEMICILQDTLDRTREEMKLLKDKSVSKSSFGLPWRNGKKKMVRVNLFALHAVNLLKQLITYLCIG